MNIKTKYNINESVYFMYNNKVSNACVDDIYIQIKYNRFNRSMEPNIDIFYIVLVVINILRMNYSQQKKNLLNHYEEMYFKHVASFS